MELGLFCLMSQRDRNKPARQIYTEMLEQVRLAESIGFDVAWLAEHHFSNYCLCPSPLAMATWLAPQTERIRLGTGVIVAPLYEPVRLLEDIAVLDNLSDGRVVLGFGAGYQHYEFHKFGVDLANARAMLLETLDLVERWLTAEPLAFDGEHIRIPETWFRVRPVQARPDVYVAGMVNDPETQRRAVERGYRCIVTTGWNTLEGIAKVRDGIATRHAALGGDGANPPFAFQQYVHVTDSRDEAMAAIDNARYIRRTALAMRHGYGKVVGSFLEETPAEDEPPMETLLERMMVGDAETVAERMIRELEVLRPVHVSCFMAVGGLEQRKILASMERFGADVLPAIERHFGGRENVGRSRAAGAAGD